MLMEKGCILIITITLNPAIDKTIKIDKLVSGGMHRINEIEFDIGGKGINVSRCIKALGGESVALGIIGGSTGDYIETELDKDGIGHDFIRVSDESRTNTKVVDNDGRVTELNEAGPIIEDKYQEIILQKIEEYADENSIFVLAGSMPRGIDSKIYGEMIKVIKRSKGRVILDAEGMAFFEGIKEVPDVIKPNKLEMTLLQKAMGFDEDNEFVTIECVNTLINSGIKVVAVSLGEEGACFYNNKGESLYRKALEVEAKSTVGAGDAMVAAIAFSMENGNEFTQMVDLAMAVSAASVTLSGTKPPSKELVEDMLIKEV